MRLKEDVIVWLSDQQNLIQTQTFVNLKILTFNYVLHFNLHKKNEVSEVIIIYLELS